MNGTAEAPAAGTILNALASGKGSAFAIDAYTTATVSLDTDADTVTGEIESAPDADTRLIERCVELATERYGDGEGGTVTTESEVPMASGLKSSSAAANATVLATLDALGKTETVERETACLLGVEAARDVGVTITGAFDDASASMLGGVTVTDNTEDELLAHETVDWDVLVYTPPEQAFSADADVERCHRIAPVAELVAELAVDGRYGLAMTVNGFAFSAALEFPTAPAIEALPEAYGVSLSGTGPSVVAIGDRKALEGVQEKWNKRRGTTWLTTTQSAGARTR
ncbi:shikimate kinase [Natranaeroarchaeum aerophilus]|uniref:Shikimate kinase n=1 Tax=Natranaeroarchaeum aerophilus TaxID=2917711 RepID=A0AAE3K5H4_9EURY|nr:shikimate kinase [Natranaeroarchaeum aerophilus]MCL9813400.1 shikimate kinase [Natranaeroarchaeum aerophilus]